MHTHWNPEQAPLSGFFMKEGEKIEKENNGSSDGVSKRETYIGY